MRAIEMIDRGGPGTMYATDQLIKDARSATLPATRYWEVDAVRGIAVVLMVLFHLMWDLFYFGIYTTNMLGGPWQVFARSIGATFLLLLGLSATLVDARLEQRVSRPSGRAGSRFSWYLVRGGKIVGLGLLITLATAVVLASGVIVFGMLHLLGVSLVLLYPFLRARRWLIVVLALAMIGTGFFLNVRPVGYPWLLWLGLPPRGWFMVDYYPVLPWFGVALLGVAAGRTFYPAGIRRYAVPEVSGNWIVRGLSLLGRHSLVIYLTHQPILIGLLILLGYGSF
jgi:uncharacterized membrane protein